MQIISVGILIYGSDPFPVDIYYGWKVVCLDMDSDFVEPNQAARTVYR